MNSTNLVEDLRLLPLPVWWESPWFLCAAILAIGIASYALTAWWQRRRPAPAAVVESGPPPEEAFLRRLAELRQRRHTLSAHALSVEVSDLLREYLEARFRLPIQYQTTREFLEFARQRPELKTSQQVVLGQFLGACDGVKFARREATDAEQGGLLDTAERVIRESAAP
jgi:hypothetical protein